MYTPRMQLQIPQRRSNSLLVCGIHRRTHPLIIRKPPQHRHTFRRTQRHIVARHTTVSRRPTQRHTTGSLRVIKPPRDVLSLHSLTIFHTIGTLQQRLSLRHNTHHPRACRLASILGIISLNATRFIDCRLVLGDRFRVQFRQGQHDVSAHLLQPHYEHIGQSRMFTANVPVFFTACSSCAACVSAGWGDRCFVREWWGVFRAAVIENWGVVMPLALTKNGVQDVAWRRSPRPRREHV